MHEQCAQLLRLFSQNARGHAVDLHRLIRLRFGLVHRSVSGGIDDDIGPGFPHPPPDGVAAGQVNLGKVHAGDPGHRRQCAAQLPANLADLPYEQDMRQFHSYFACPTVGRVTPCAPATRDSSPFDWFSAFTARTE